MILSSKILTVKGYRSAFVKYKPTNVLLFIIFRLFITVSKCLPLNHISFLNRCLKVLLQLLVLIKLEF